MPYSPDDKNLPPNVQKMPMADRQKWCNTWNGVFDNCTKQGGSKPTCERRAFKLANGTFTAHPKRTRKATPKKPAARLYRAACSSAWAITEDTLATILDIARRENPDPLAVALELGRPLDGARHAEARGPVAVLHAQGPIARRATLFSEMSGGASVESLALDLQVAARDPAIKAICLAVDSPGGQVNGVHELARAIRAAAAAKPTVAYVSHLGASAAYWLAAACPEVVCDATAQLGNIGVIGVVHGDAPPKDGEGKRYTFVSSQSPNKRPDPESDEGRAMMQANIDALATIFLADVADFRGVDAREVADRFGRGAVFVGQEAVDAGLADRLGSFEGVIADLTARVTPAGAPATNPDPAPRPLRPAPEPVRDAARLAAAARQDRAIVASLLEQYGVEANPIDIADGPPAGMGEAIKIDGQGLAPIVSTTLTAAGGGGLPTVGTDFDPAMTASLKRLIRDEADRPMHDASSPPVEAAYRQPDRRAAAAAPVALATSPAAAHQPEGAVMEPQSVLDQALAALEEQGNTDLADALRDAAAAQDAELAEAREAAAAAAATSTALQTQVDSLEASVGEIRSASRRERFKAEVMGQANDGLRWRGEPERNVAMLERLADAFGEDSEEFATYREQQRAAAAALRDSDLFTEIGAAGTGKPAPRFAGRGPRMPHDETQQALDTAVAELRAANPALSYFSATQQVFKAKPALRDAYYAAHDNRIVATKGGR